MQLRQVAAWHRALCAGFHFAASLAAAQRQVLVPHTRLSSSRTLKKPQHRNHKVSDTGK